MESCPVSDRHALPPAVCFQADALCKVAFAVLPVHHFGVIRAGTLGEAPPQTRVFLQSPQFNYVISTGAVLDELCWGCGSSFSSDLESALIQMVVAVGEDLEAAVARLRPMMSLVAGAAAESDHMLLQMKKDVAAALGNSHRSLAIGRLHQFLDQLSHNGGEMSMVMSLPQSFKDAAAAFFTAKASCLPPSRFRQRLRAAVDAAVQLRKAITSAPAAQQLPCAALASFISEASKVALDSDAPVTAAEADVAALLRPKLLGPRLPSLTFMPVLSMEELQARCRCAARARSIRPKPLSPEYFCAEAICGLHVRAP